jgi:3-oxoacyl-[acyl-carrier-protein] synthase-3
MTAPTIDQLAQDRGSLPLAGTGAATTTAVAVAGWGYALPARRVTNDDLAQSLDTSDAWIAERTGIRERRVSGAGESTGPLAVTASRAALDRAGIVATDVDVVVVATSTPERLIPSTAAIVAAELGITAGAFDLNAACAGFVYGLTTAAALIGNGLAGTALVVGADTLTRFTDPDDRATAVLFGDAAGALVLAGTGSSAPTHPGPPEPAAPGLVSCDLVGDPGASTCWWCPQGGAPSRPAPLRWRPGSTTCRWTDERSSAGRYVRWPRRSTGRWPVAGVPPTT